MRKIINLIAAYFIKRLDEQQLLEDVSRKLADKFTPGYVWGLEVNTEFKMRVQAGVEEELCKRITEKIEQDILKDIDLKRVSELIEFKLVRGSLK